MTTTAKQTHYKIQHSDTEMPRDSCPIRQPEKGTILTYEKTSVQILKN